MLLVSERREHAALLIVGVEEGVGVDVIRLEDIRLQWVDDVWFTGVKLCRIGLGTFGEHAWMSNNDENCDILILTVTKYNNDQFA